VVNVSVRRTGGLNVIIVFQLEVVAFVFSHKDTKDTKGNDALFDRVYRIFLLGFMRRL